MPRQTYAIANWKMHGSLSLLEGWSDSLPDPGRATVILCPPYPLLYAAQSARAKSAERFLVGAQDCHWQQQGAFTGEVSALMLRDAGATHVLVGHSERRTLMGETHEYVREKCLAVLTAGLVPIVCIGENHAEYEAQETYPVLANQLYEGLPKQAKTADVIIAYEPVWAIGTGLTPTPGQIQDCHDHIRTFLSAHWSAERAEVTPVLYGGSVKPQNTAEIIACPDVDGLLVGGASLDPESFAAIIGQCG